MKFYNLFFILFCTVHSLAVTVEIKDPCQNRSLIEQEVVPNFSKKESIGHLTIQLLNDKNIPYRGSAAGLASIYNTPQSDASLEIVSSDEFFAYGWCYHLNGEEPGEMPDQVYLSSDSDHIVWFFGYSHYFHKEWISMCTPAFNRPLKSYCDLKQIKP